MACTAALGERRRVRRSLLARRVPALAGVRALTLALVSSRASLPARWLAPAASKAFSHVLVPVLAVPCMRRCRRFWPRHRRRR